jgi:uncharacterized membrane protein
MLPIIGLVAGILGVVFLFIWQIPAWVSIILGVAAIVIAVLEMKAGRKTGLVIAALVVGIVATAIAGIYWVACATAASAVNDAARSLF